MAPTALNADGNSHMATDFTIADVLAWARTKPADERYNYSDLDNCALCQFLRDTGRAIRPEAGGSFWSGVNSLGETIGGDIQTGLDRALVAQTFGALVTRLEALCPETGVTPSNWARLDAYLTDIELASA